jgi:hypothetical protein
MAEEQGSDDPEKAEKLQAVIEAIESNGAEKILPIEAARAQLRHWWREPLAGMLALGIGVYDSWRYGRDAGLSSSLDEILVVGGIVLIAGSRRLFSPPAVLQRPSPQKDIKG